MANSLKQILHCLALFLIFHSNLFSVSAVDDRKLHIVYMGAKHEDEFSTSSRHLRLLQQVTKTNSPEKLLVQNYKRSFSGFAAMLSDSEAKQLESSNEVVSVFPSMTYKLQTTRSWNFLNFTEKAQRNPPVESDLIVGVLDSGIWPESESFNDKGFGPPPKKWKGTCNGGQNFTCNNKLIGARYYGSQSGTARDTDGHGTHTASTAAGRNVENASFFGLGNGTARGGVPSARIAAYSVCPDGYCDGADILAGFDDAIADGVDIISISIGYSYPFDYDSDVIAIGSFHAIEKGILTSHSAGNNGPDSGQVSSVAPWILTVAAGSTDRRFIAKAIPGNGKELVGNSINSFDLKGVSLPLINGSKAQTKSCSLSSNWCSGGCLNRTLVNGKIVICDYEKGAVAAKRSGAAGSILRSTTKRIDVSFMWPLPALVLPEDQMLALASYMKSTKNPAAKLLKSEAIKDSKAPLVASFSSRGPNPIVSDILKPDIVAPGIDILASYVPTVSPSDYPDDDRRSNFSIVSGTSMACPHATAVAAYVKSFHPEWSPAAIKSAIMTTAIPMDSIQNSGAEFAYGSGGINPLGAVNPGLVYDIQTSDYAVFLCSIGYKEAAVKSITGDNSTSSTKGYKKETAKDLNYPSMTVKVAANQSFKISFTRTVTNVGTPKSTYKPDIVETSKKFSVVVEPNVLSFDSIDEKKSFNVTVSGSGLAAGEMVSASLVWKDGSHKVRSPIVVYS